MFLANDAGDVLLMSCRALLLPCLLLVSTATALSLHTSLGSLEPLRLDQLSVADLLVLFLLVLHDRQFGLFKHLHARLLQRLQAEDVEHGLNLSIEVEQLPVIVENLRLLAVLLRGHLRLEKRHRRSVQIKLSGNADLLCRWLVCQVLNVLVGLKASMHTARYGLWRRNITIRIDRYDTLGRLHSDLISTVCVGTYLGGRFECALAEALGLLRLALLHDHGVVRGTSRDDHGGV